MSLGIEELNDCQQTSGRVNSVLNDSSVARTTLQGLIVHLCGTKRESTAACRLLTAV